MDFFESNFEPTMWDVTFRRLLEGRELYDVVLTMPGDTMGEVALKAELISRQFDEQFSPIKHWCVAITPAN